MDKENLAVQLIVHAGNAKSQSMKAIAFAKKGELSHAHEQLKESDAAMVEAHKFQTEALQHSFDEPDVGVNMLMAHAQDHLMGAITTQTLAIEFIELYERVDVLTKLVKGDQKL